MKQTAKEKLKENVTNAKENAPFLPFQMKPDEAPNTLKTIRVIKKTAKAF